jgi:hypothetical protein
MSVHTTANTAIAQLSPSVKIAPAVQLAPRAAPLPAPTTTPQPPEIAATAVLHCSSSQLIEKPIKGARTSRRCILISLLKEYKMAINRQKLQEFSSHFTI